VCLYRVLSFSPNKPFIMECDTGSKDLTITQYKKKERHDTLHMRTDSAAVLL